MRTRGNASEKAMKTVDEQIKPVALVRWIEYNIVPFGVPFRRIPYTHLYRSQDEQSRTRDEEDEKKEKKNNSDPKTK